MAKQVLIDYMLFEPSPRMINESRMNPSKNLVVEGKVQAAGKPNANRRVYDFDTLRREVDRYIRGPIAEKRATGELDHPETSVINLKNVCHNITDLWWEGQDLYGRFEILPTPSGNILKELFLNGINVGVSSRALGSTSPLGEGLVQVEDDLELICWDFVSTPSTYGAFVKPVGQMNEGFIPQGIIENPYSKVNSVITDILCLQTGICCLN